MQPIRVQSQSAAGKIGLWYLFSESVKISCYFDFLLLNFDIVIRNCTALHTHTLLRQWEPAQIRFAGIQGSSLER